MSAKPGMAELEAFASIVAHRSFRKAADDLGLSPSTLSHMMRSLELRTGVRLLNRTTRSVAPTEAGERLASRMRPLLHDFDLALREIDSYRERPSGVLRINASQGATSLLLRKVAPQFIAQYPEMHLDLVTEGKLVDIVAQGFDAGVRLGETVPQDMISVRFGADVRFLAVASLAYLEGRSRPQTPDDLADHQCIRFRMPSGKILRWEFARHGQELEIDVQGPLTLDHMELMVEAAVDGFGIAYVPAVSAAAHIEAGRLHSVLDEWCPTFAGLFLYYPGHRHVPAGLRAFIDVVKATDFK